MDRPEAVTGVRTLGEIEAAARRVAADVHADPMKRLSAFGVAAALACWYKDKAEFEAWCATITWPPIG